MEEKMLTAEEQLVADLLECADGAEARLEEGLSDKRPMAYHEALANAAAHAGQVAARVPAMAKLMREAAALLSSRDKRIEELEREIERMLKAERLQAACRPDETQGDAKAFVHWGTEALAARAALATLISRAPVAQDLIARRQVMPEPIPTTDDADLLPAIKRLKRELPGWWFTTGRCGLSCHASVGPDRFYIPEPTLSRFDDGFHADIDNPSTCGSALNAAIDKAVAAQATLSALPFRPMDTGR